MRVTEGAPHPHPKSWVWAGAAALKEGKTALGEAKGGTFLCSGREGEKDRRREEGRRKKERAPYGQQVHVVVRTHHFKNKDNIPPEVACFSSPLSPGNPR